MSELCYKGTSWSFSYNSFVKFHGKKINLEATTCCCDIKIHVCVIMRCVINVLHFKCFLSIIQIALLKILLAAAPTSKTKTDSINILADLLPEEMP